MLLNFKSQEIFIDATFAKEHCGATCLQQFIEFDWTIWQAELRRELRHQSPQCSMSGKRGCPCGSQT